MIRTFEILIRPNGSAIDFLDLIKIKIESVLISIIFQDNQGMSIDVDMDLAFGPYDDFFKRIQDAEKIFQERPISRFKWYHKLTPL